LQAVEISQQSLTPTKISTSFTASATEHVTIINLNAGEENNVVRFLNTFIVLCFYTV
jgi:hypothetical protein